MWGTHEWTGSSLGREDVGGNALVEVPVLARRVLIRFGEGVEVVLDLRVVLPVQRDRTTPGLRGGVDVGSDALVRVPIVADQGFDLGPRRRDDVVRLADAVELVQRDSVRDARTRRVAVDRGYDRLAHVLATCERSLNFASVGRPDAVREAVAGNAVERNDWEAADLCRASLRRSEGT